VSQRPGLVFEAHSTDYQLESSLQALVRDHYAILKVGPALTFALREALFGLSAIEAELLPAELRAQLPAVLEQEMLKSPGHWSKHYQGSPDEQLLLRRYALSDRCRYYWGEPALRAAQQRLFANLDGRRIPLPLLSQHLPAQYAAVMEGRLPLRAQDLVEHKIGQVVEAYARACGKPKIESAVAEVSYTV